MHTQNRDTAAVGCLARRSSYLHRSTRLCISQCSRAGGISGSRSLAQSLGCVQWCCVAVSLRPPPPQCCPAGGRTCTSPHCQSFPRNRKNSSIPDFDLEVLKTSCGANQVFNVYVVFLRLFNYVLMYHFKPKN